MKQHRALNQKDFQLWNGCAQAMVPFKNDYIKAKVSSWLSPFGSFGGSGVKWCARSFQIKLISVNIYCCFYRDLCV